MIRTFPTPRPCPTAVLFLAFVLLLAGSLPAAAGPFHASVAAGGIAGLEDLARGAAISVEAGFHLAMDPGSDRGSSSGPVEARDEGLGAALVLGLLYDRGLGLVDGTLALRAGLVLLAGPDLRLEAGAEFLLGESPALAPRDFPLRIALETVLVELAPGSGWRPRLSLDGELSWTDYEARGESAARPDAGLLAFEAGIRAGLLLRASAPRP